MTDSDFNLYADEESIDIKGEFFKYLKFWPWFLSTACIALLGAFAYLQYTKPVYVTEAIIKIIDEDEASGLDFNIKSIFKRSTVVLENEIYVFNSYQLNSKVVNKLKLNIRYFQTNSFGSNEIFTPAFEVSYAAHPDSLVENLIYELKITKNGYEITDSESEESFTTSGYSYKGTEKGFPINITPLAEIDASVLENPNYSVQINTVLNTATALKKVVEINVEGEDNDVLLLSLISNNGGKAKTILNALIAEYETDGINDRQEISKRTIEFVNQRFEFLLKELDSIEDTKKNYKTSNNISFIEADAGISIQNQNLKEEVLFNIETQILLSDILKNTLIDDAGFQLLPANIGIENASTNQLISDYNTALLTYEKLKTSGGANNPTVSALESNINELKNNISRSVNGYLQQLQTTLNQSKAAQQRANSAFAMLPEKENILRKIERQQNLKEKLYIILLQKREQAAVEYAVTVSNVKVIDYGITNPIPVGPKKKIIYLGALLVGLLVPLGVIYLMFLLDTKVRSTKELVKALKELPLLAEIPQFAKNKLFLDPNENTPFTESFRILTTSIDFLMPKKPTTEAQVIFFTSSIKGEGKTFNAINTALAYSSINKKVLIVGADLRNPQLHSYFGIDKNQKGLSLYLNDPEMKAADCILKESNSKKLPIDMVLSGAIPPNASALLKNGRFEHFITEMKPLYDYIIFDTAPILLVADTSLISKYCDFMVYLTKFGHTEKSLLEIPANLLKSGKVNHIGVIFNGIGEKSGYKYEYGYNYGYGYGYGVSEQK